MFKLTIDDREVEVPAGATVLDAARALGIAIPTLCVRDGHPPNTSCMVCVVRVDGRAALVPACATRAEDGMRVESGSEDVRRARRTALELLLSEHAGDCQAPCQRICPAHMDIPRMIRQIRDGSMRDAIVTVKATIALPAVLGRICPAPCEGGCRRKPAGGAVSICLLKRHAADVDLASSAPYLPARQPATGKRVAIVGAGPAGLAAAYYLLQEGHACVVFDDREQLGGMLRYGVPESDLPRDVLAAEIAILARLGAEFRSGVRIGRDVTMDALRKEFDAVAIAAGDMKEPGAFGVKTGPQGIAIDAATFATDVPGVFAGGNAVRAARKMAVIAVADGRGMAISIHQHLSGLPVTGPGKPFNSVIAKVADAELAVFLSGASPKGRIEPGGGPGAGFAATEAVGEAKRCLHCDCRRQDGCLLRTWGEAYAAQANRFTGERRPFTQARRPGGIIYEAGKCISCGICVQIAAEAKEPRGLAFVGRGFDVRVAVPFNRSIEEGLTRVAAECVKACPTGALALDANGPAWV